MEGDMSASMKGRVNEGVSGEEYTDHQREVGSTA
jgi:hypothetical protein